jgi:hypothetical protein
LYLSKLSLSTYTKSYFTSICVRINGYRHNDEDIPFEWSADNDSECSDILKGKVKLLDDQFFRKDTVIHVFVEICDNRGKEFHSPYITRQVKIQ